VSCWADLFWLGLVLLLFREFGAVVSIDGVVGDAVFLNAATADVVDDEWAALLVFFVTDNHDVGDVARQHVADDVPGLTFGDNGGVERAAAT